jgi:hypothetical protein
LALTITFSKDVVGEISPGERKLLIAAWVAYFISVFFGVWTLHALTGSLASLDKTISDEQKVFTSNARFPSGVQIVTFLIGLVLTVIFGILAV